RPRRESACAAGGLRSEPCRGASGTTRSGLRGRPLAGPARRFGRRPRRHMRRRGCSRSWRVPLGVGGHPWPWSGLLCGYGHPTHLPLPINPASATLCPNIGNKRTRRAPAQSSSPDTQSRVGSFRAYGHPRSFREWHPLISLSNPLIWVWDVYAMLGPDLLGAGHHFRELDLVQPARPLDWPKPALPKPLYALPSPYLAAKVGMHVLRLPARQVVAERLDHNTPPKFILLITPTLAVFLHR